jgi:hypothetical protein
VSSTGVVTSASRVPLWSTTWVTSEIGASGGVSPGSMVTSSRSWPRASVASVHRTRSHEMRTGPVSRTRTGRQIPPGFHSGSRLSQCENTPVIVRFAVRSVWRGLATSTASTFGVSSTWRVISNVWGKK